MNLLGAFSHSIEDISSLKTEQDVIERSLFLVDHTRHFFQKENYHLALAGLDFLMRHKQWQDAEKRIPLMRRDKETPEYLHEIRQIIAAKGYIEKGILPKKSSYGSSEILFCAILFHDFGEDFNLLPDELSEHLSKKIIYNPALRSRVNKRSKYIEKTIPEIVNIMELMTLDRKYEEQEIKQALGLNQGQTLTEKKLQKFLRNLESRSLAATQSKKRPLQIIKNPTKEDGYIVSRYIVDGIIDWNSYTDAMSENPFAILAKFFDRNEGLSTRIGKKFDIKSYDHYLERTEQVFSSDAIARDMRIKYPSFKGAFRRLDSMMGALYRTGKTYVNHHPEYNPEGGKGFASKTMKLINFRDYFPKALEGYGALPNGLHPLHMILERIRKSNDLNGFGPKMYEHISKSIELCAENNKAEPYINNLGLFRNRVGISPT